MSILKVPVGPDDHSTGEIDAPHVLVEYGDYECPHCARAVPIVERIKTHFGDNLRFIFRNFPLTQIHPEAQPAAEVAEFAGVRGKFWEMHDLLFENQDRLGAELYIELVEGLGLSSEDLREAMTAGTYAKRVRHDFSGGVRSGVNGTPTFFVKGQRYNGTLDYDHLIEAIELA